MAQVIFTGPTPERPNPFEAFGKSLGTGLGGAFDTRIRAEQAADSLGKLGTEATAGMDKDTLIDLFVASPDLLKNPTAVAGLLKGQDTDIVKNLKAAGLKPGTQEFRDALLRASKAVPDDPTKVVPATSRLVGPDGKIIVDAAPKEITPQSALGKLRKDFEDGLISRDDFAAERRNILASNEPLYEVQDPNDPKRITYLPRSQAVGLSPASNQNTRQAKINSLVSQGASEQDAANLVDGLVETVVTPQGGVLKIDKVNNTVTETPVGTGGGAADMGLPGERKTLLSDVSVFGGIAPAAEAVQKYTFGLFGDDTQRNEQRQRFRLFRENLKDAFMRGGRPSNFADQRVEQLLPSSGVFESRASAYDQLATIAEMLKANIAEDDAIAKNPNIPRERRGQAQSDILASRRALDMLGDPTKFPRPGARPQSPIPQPGQGEAQPVPRGADGRPDADRLQAGAIYDTPRGRARYLGNGQFETVP